MSDADDLIAFGYAARNRGDTSEALQKYTAGAAAYAISGDAFKLALAIRHIGDIHQDSGELDAAEPCYIEALAIYRTTPNPPALALANALRPFALLHEAKGNKAAAIPLWQEARDLYTKVGVEAAIEECERHLTVLGHSPSQ